MVAFSEAEDTGDLERDFQAQLNPYSSGESDFDKFNEDDIPINAPDHLMIRRIQTSTDREHPADFEFGWLREDSSPLSVVW